MHVQTECPSSVELRRTPEFVVDDVLMNNLSQSTCCLAHEFNDLVMIGADTLFGLSTGHSRAFNGTFRRSFEDRVGRSLKTSTERTLPFSKQVKGFTKETTWVNVWIASATSITHKIGKDVEAEGV